MAKRKHCPRHEALLEMGRVVLPKASIHTGVSVRIKEHGKSLGLLSFGQGGIYWKPGNNRFNNQLNLNWSQLANLLTEQMA